MITSEGERGVMENVERKSAAADMMFDRLVKLMGSELEMIRKQENNQTKEEIPLWL
jgi:hypothetical protein